MGASVDPADLPWWVRHPYLVLTALACAWIGLRHGGPATDWDYFRQGSDLILGRHTMVSAGPNSVAQPQLSTLPGGLHLFANYPVVQIGPLSLVLVALVRWISGPYGRVVTVSLGTLLCTPAVWLVMTARVIGPNAEDARRRATLVLIGGCALLAVWTQATLVYSHVDDALVLVFAALAVRSVVRGNGVLLGVAVALAAAAKPTGLVLLPLLLALGGRQRIRACVLAFAGIALVWLPFVVADQETLRAVSPTIETARASALHVLGFHGRLPWVRAAQLGLSILAGVAAVLRGRWPAALLVAAAGRLLLEPGAVSYYTASIVLGALVWETLVLPRPRGLVTAAVCAGFYLVPFRAVYSLLPARPLLTEPLDGWLRLVLCTALIVAVTSVPREWRARFLTSYGRQP